jgi:hypothetical protein
VAGIDEEMDESVLFVLKRADERSGEPRGRLPVQETDVIPLGVVAEFAEFRAAPGPR